MVGDPICGGGVTLRSVYSALSSRWTPGLDADTFFDRGEIRVLRSSGRLLRLATCIEDRDDDGHRAYLVTWPRRALCRSALSRTSPTESADALWRLACGVSPDGRCLRLGCWLPVGHRGEHEDDGDVWAPPLRGQLLMPWVA